MREGIFGESSEGDETLNWTLIEEPRSSVIEYKVKGKREFSLISEMLY